MHGGRISSTQPYTKMLAKIGFVCNVCSHTWVTSPNAIVNGKKGCAMCCKTHKWTDEEFQAKLWAVHGSGVICDEKYVNSTTRHTFQCTNCGESWKTTPASVITLKTGCMKCRKSTNPGMYTLNSAPEKLHIYLVKLDYCLKVGLSKAPTERLKKLRTTSQSKTLEILFCRELSGRNAIEAEHNVLASCSRYTPSHKFYGSTECINFSEEAKAISIINASQIEAII